MNKKRVTRTDRAAKPCVRDGACSSSFHFCVLGAKYKSTPRDYHPSSDLTPQPLALQLMRFENVNEQLRRGGRGVSRKARATVMRWPKQCASPSDCRSDTSHCPPIRPYLQPFACALTSRVSVCTYTVSVGREPRVSQSAYVRCVAPGPSADLFFILTSICILRAKYLGYYLEVSIWVLYLYIFQLLGTSLSPGASRPTRTFLRPADGVPARADRCWS